jgi:hypothetical protein
MCSTGVTLWAKFMMLQTMSSQLKMQAQVVALTPLF